MQLELLESIIRQADSRSEEAEQCFVLTQVSWEQYETLLEEISDDFPGLHVTYLEGTLEIVSPSRKHERNKTNIGLLLEAYFEETRTRFYGLGSTTFRKRAKARGVEPDECYCIESEKEFPDIAIEVVKTSGGVNKLEVYCGLEVPEVWFWRNDRFSIYRLKNGEYEQILRSEFFPNLDLELLATFVLQAEPLDAVLGFREALRRQD